VSSTIYCRVCGGGKGVLGCVGDHTLQDI
jgi:hypothetical protein